MNAQDQIRERAKELASEIETAFSEALEKAGGSETGECACDPTPIIEKYLTAAESAHREEVERLTKERTVFKRDWVNCPICGEPDMRREWFASKEDGPYIKCVNIGCASNGGRQCDGWIKSQFQGKSPIAYETAILLTKAVEAQCEATGKAESERDTARAESTKLREVLEKVTEAAEEWDRYYQTALDECEKEINAAKIDSDAYAVNFREGKWSGLVNHDIALTKFRQCAALAATVLKEGE